jgi:holin-like protein
MIYEIFRVLACLAIGEALSHFCAIPIPGTVIGLILLLICLHFRGSVPDNLSILADRMLGLFGLFFVPAGAGVIGYFSLISSDFITIMLAVTAGTFVTIASIGLSIKHFTGPELR